MRSNPPLALAKSGFHPVGTTYYRFLLKPCPPLSGGDERAEDNPLARR
jgi:hypothetical protein